MKKIKTPLIWIAIGFALYFVLKIFFGIGK